MKQVFVLAALLSAMVCFGQKQSNDDSIPTNDSILINSDLTDFRIQIVVDTIILSGNKTTHPSIIFRELTFSQSDTIPAFEFYNNLSRSRENLLNTSLFNFVTMHDSVFRVGDMHMCRYILNLSSAGIFGQYRYSKFQTGILIHGGKQKILTEYRTGYSLLRKT